MESKQNSCSLFRKVGNVAVMQSLGLLHWHQKRDTEADLSLNNGIYQKKMQMVYVSITVAKRTLRTRESNLIARKDMNQSVCIWSWQFKRQWDRLSCMPNKCSVCGMSLLVINYKKEKKKKRKALTL